MNTYSHIETFRAWRRIEAKKDDARRQEQVPHLHVRGTYYQVGFNVGRTFKGLIEDFYGRYKYLQDELIPRYESSEGKHIYDISLAVAQKRFPGYVQELQGISHGAQIPFEQIYLVHIGGLIDPSEHGSKGCTTLIMNGEKQILLGHTEDALKEIINNFYIVSAEVISEEGKILEKFTTLSYPGMLLGGTMGFNYYGIVHTINYIFPKQVFPDRSPHLFIMRAILKAKTLDEVLDIVKDEGCGTSDGFSVNLIVLSESNDSESCPRAFNIEISPNQGGNLESEVFVEEISRGAAYSHCNQFLRCKTPEKAWIMHTSCERHETIKKFNTPYNMTTLKKILSEEVDDGQDKVEYSIFKRAMQDDDFIATIAVGIFDIYSRTWSLYTRPPSTQEPVVIIPIQIQPYQ